MASNKSITSILTDLSPKRLAVIESSFRKTAETPRKGERFFLELKLNLDIGLTGGRNESDEKRVRIVTTGNANVFSGTLDAPNEKRQLAECLVKVETMYEAKPNTTEDDLKRHGSFFTSHSSIAIYSAIRSLVANTDFHNMPLPLPGQES